MQSPVTIRSNRRGFSLHELVVTMSVGSVLMALAMGWIYQSLKFSGHLRGRQRQHQSLTRLAWDLREDALHCKSMSIEEANELILAMKDGSKVSYQINENAILMTQPLLGSDKISRERYELTPGAVAVWETEEMPDWVSLIVYRARENASIADYDPKKPTRERLDPDRLPAIDAHLRVGPKSD